MNAGERSCPFCAETIKAQAVLCRYCRKAIEPVAAKAGAATPRWWRGIGPIAGLLVLLIAVGMLTPGEDQTHSGSATNRPAAITGLGDGATLAAGYSAQAAAACFGYATAAKKIDVAAAARRLTEAHRDETVMTAHGRAFLAKIERIAAQDKVVAAQVLVNEGRAGCSAIGAM